MSTYNGWKNRETWNVSLWLNNTEEFYRTAVDFMRTYKGRKPYKDFIATYSGAGVGSLLGLETGDRVMWSDSQLDYNALNEMMRELV